MPHDCVGEPLQAGDLVDLPMTVKSVSQAEDGCNVDLEAPKALPGSDYRPTVTCNGAFVRKHRGPYFPIFGVLPGARVRIRASGKMGTVGSVMLDDQLTKLSYVRMDGGGATYLSEDRFDVVPEEAKGESSEDAPVESAEEDLGAQDVDATRADTGETPAAEPAASDPS